MLYAYYRDVWVGRVRSGLSPREAVHTNVRHKYTTLEIKTVDIQFLKKISFHQILIPFWK